MNLKLIALTVGAVQMLQTVLSTQTIVPLVPWEQLSLLCVGAVCTYALLHLPSVNGYIVGEPDPVPVAAPVPHA